MAEGIDWRAILIAYFLAVITNLIILAVYILILRRRRQRRKLGGGHSRIDRLESMRSDRPLTEHMVSGDYRHRLAHSTSRQTSLESEVSRPGRSGQSRIHRDYVMKWCGSHNLPEVIATVLRDNGFNTPEYLESLKPGDVPALGLPNKGTECLLRQVLEAKEEAKTRKTSVSSNKSARTSQTYRRYSGDDRPPRSPVSLNPAGPQEPLLNKSSSYENTSDTQNISLTSNGHRDKRSSESVMQTDAQGVKKPNGNTPLYIQMENKHGFNGLLSNPGLHHLAGMLGREWTFLGTQLNITMAKMDHLRADHPNDTRSQIYYMLVYWRDLQHGSKEKIKGELCKALQDVGRNDIVDKILQEQVKGSVEKIYSTSIL